MDKRQEKCLPCYNKIVDNECVTCWGADTKTCDSSQCADMGGAWHGDQCHNCVSWDPSGCSDEPSCDAVGGVWWPMERECRPCNPEQGNLWGCSEEQCKGGTMRWKHGECQPCDPEKEQVYGCGKQECMDLKTDYPMVEYLPSSDYCGFCNPRDGGHIACSKENCMPSAEFPDLLWMPTMMWDEEKQMDVESGYCARCTSSEQNGCVTRQLCMDAGPDFVWRKHCPDDPGLWEAGGCCSQCTYDDPTGCEHEDKCKERGGEWCMSQEECHWPGSNSCWTDDSGGGGGGGGQCGQVTQHDLDKAYAKGYTPRYC